MNLLVMLFLLKLYARVNIFKHIEEKYGQKEIKLARVIRKKRSRITKIQCDIKYLLSSKQNGLISLFAKPKFSIRLATTYARKLDGKYRTLKSRINIEKSEN